MEPKPTLHGWDRINGYVVRPPFSPRLSAGIPEHTLPAHMSWCLVAWVAVTGANACASATADNRQVIRATSNSEKLIVSVRGAHVRFAVPARFDNGVPCICWRRCPQKNDVVSNIGPLVATHYSAGARP